MKKIRVFIALLLVFTFLLFLSSCFGLFKLAKIADKSGVFYDDLEFSLSEDGRSYTLLGIADWYEVVDGIPVLKNVVNYDVSELEIPATYKELPGKYKVTYSGGDAVNLRETASSSGKILASIPNGTILQSLEGSTDTWIKVTYKNSKGKEFTGWIGSGLLTKVTE